MQQNDPSCILALSKDHIPYQTTISSLGNPNETKALILNHRDDHAELSRVESNSSRDFEKIHDLTSIDSSIDLDIVRTKSKNVNFRDLQDSKKIKEEGGRDVGEIDSDEPSEKIHHRSKKISREENKDTSRSVRSRKTWSTQEDKRILKLIQEYGFNWTVIAQKIEWARTGKQIRDRYLNKLDPNINNSTWTKEEDALLVKLYKIKGRKWCEISKNITGRTEAMVKNRFYSKFRHLFNQGGESSAQHQLTNSCEEGEAHFKSREEIESYEKDRTEVKKEYMEIESTSNQNIKQVLRLNNQNSGINYEYHQQTPSSSDQLTFSRISSYPETLLGSLATQNSISSVGAPNPFMEAAPHNYSQILHQAADRMNLHKMQQMYLAANNLGNGRNFLPSLENNISYPTMPYFQHLRNSLNLNNASKEAEELQKMNLINSDKLVSNLEGQLNALENILKTDILSEVWINHLRQLTQNTGQRALANEGLSKNDCAKLLMMINTRLPQLEYLFTDSVRDLKQLLNILVGRLSI